MAKKNNKKGHKSSDQEQQPKKQFRELDYKAGTFQLWDKVFQVYRTWKVDDDSSPGIGVLNEKLEQEGNELRKYFPKKFYTLTRAERKKVVSDYISDMPEDQQRDYLDKVKRNSDKQLAVMCAYLEPQDEIPEIWDNKLEFLASCLSHEADTGRISDFFLRRLADSTILPEQSQETKETEKS